MKRLSFSFLLTVLTMSAPGHAAPPAKKSARTVETETMVASLYKKVVARHPFLYDLKAFAPYLSKGLLRRFNGADACFTDWERRNKGTTDKPPFDIELGPFSGRTERTGPQTFHIERSEPREDGSSRVYVKLTYAKPTLGPAWHVAAVVVRENGRPVVDDIIFLKDKERPDEWRLSETLNSDMSECKVRKRLGKKVI